jgi:hypothetical protein
VAVSRSNMNKQISNAKTKAAKAKPSKIAANIIKKAKATGVSGTRGPNYVARAMKPGGYAEGGGVGKAKPNQKSTVQTRVANTSRSGHVSAKRKKV